MKVFVTDVIPDQQMLHGQHPGPALIALLSHRGASTVQSYAALIVNEASASVYGHGLF